MASRLVVAMGAFQGRVGRPREPQGKLRLAAVLAAFAGAALGAACLEPMTTFVGLGSSWRPGAARLAPSRRAFDIGKAMDGMLDAVMGEDDDVVEVPKDVGAMVSGIKQSTEIALNDGISHLDVELPPAFRLGVEEVKGDKKKNFLLEDVIKTDDRKEVARGDRELARVFIEMLQPIADGLCVAFRTKGLAAAARKEWKLTAEEGRIISFPEKPKGAFAAEVGVPGQFKKKLKDIGCKCLVVVSPYLEELRLVEDVRSEVEDQMGIILLNARIHGVGRKMIKIPPRLKKELRQNFMPSYHVRFLGDRKNAMVFHQYRDEEKPWIVAVQRNALTSVVTQELLRAPKPPTKEQINQAFVEYDSQEKSTGDKFLDMVDGGSEA